MDETQAKTHIVILGEDKPLITTGLDLLGTLYGPWHGVELAQNMGMDRGSVRVIASVPGSHDAPIDAAVMDAFPHLEIIASFGVGYDHIDASYAASRGIMVTHTPDVLTDEVADLTVGLVVMTARNLGAAERWLRAGKWHSEGNFALSPSLRGRRIGIFGLGRIGTAVATRLAAFGLPIAYCARTQKPDLAYGFYPDAESLAEATDVLIITAPGGAETHHSINGKVFRALGPDGIVINVGRGSVIDEEALVTALEEGTILAAGLDVFANEPHVPPRLLQCSNVVLLPHVGSASVMTRAAMGQLVVDNVKTWLDAGRALTPVPECLERGMSS